MAAPPRRMGGGIAPVSVTGGIAPLAVTNNIPTITEIAASTNLNTNTLVPVSTQTNMTNTNAAATTDNGNVFTEESISGVPNWVWILAAGVGIFFLVKGQ
jgi:hypothetical protein